MSNNLQYMKVQFYCHLEFGEYILFLFTLLWGNRDSTTEHTWELRMIRTIVTKVLGAKDDTMLQ